MLEQHVSKARIAKHIGFHVSTIYREISRNSQKNARRNEKQYISYFANCKYLKRRKRKTKLEKDNTLKAFVHKKLRSRWSPWQIEWYLKHHNTGLQIIIHETTYRYIYSHWAGLDGVHLKS